ncbi:MAG TPA: hypothetical protein VET89_01985, partial [Stellaceae bacterium]|nr:hypothetical protein [Stellaceae bacterium]
GLDDPSLLPPQLVGPDIRIHTQSPPTKGNWGKIWLMQCLAMSEALNDPTVSRDAILVKIDADALVLRPGLAKRAQEIIATRPDVGQIGQCFSNIRGGSLFNFGWENFMRKTVGWRGFRKFLLAAIRSGVGWRAGFSAFCNFRKIMTRARENGYRNGSFAVGGCYILRREVIESLNKNGFFLRSPFPFLPDVGEDVVMTPHVYVVGYTVIDDISDDGIFAIEGKELRVDPFVLKARGHYVIHPTKYGYRAHGSKTFSEAELVSASLNNTEVEGAAVLNRTGR